LAQETIAGKKVERQEALVAAAIAKAAKARQKEVDKEVRQENNNSIKHYSSQSKGYAVVNHHNQANLRYRSRLNRLKVMRCLNSRLYEVAGCHANHNTSVNS
jgi:spore maturation protein CgeB